MKRAVALLAFFLVASLYVTTLVILFSMPRSVRDLTYHLRVTLSYRAWPDNSVNIQKLLKQEYELSRINGSAVAISPNGDLLTERHVVDPNFYMPWPCTGWNEWADGKEAKMNLQIQSLELVVIASNGHQWRGTAHPKNPYGPWCDEQRHMKLIWSPESDARIVAMDDGHDLALVSIRTSSAIPYVKLQKEPTIAGQDVEISGFPKGNPKMKLYNGIVMAPCEINRVITPMSVIRVTPRVSAGVSGGPIIVGNRLVGIVLGSSDNHQTIGVPGPYISKWLDWVNGKTIKPPEPVCSP